MNKVCGRYATFEPIVITPDMQSVLADIHIDMHAELSQREPRYNVAPTMKVPVLAMHDDKATVEAMRWGLVPSWAKDIKFGAKTINARADTVQTKPSFRTAFKKRRCLVPASGYFEWKGESPNKQPYFIKHPKDHLLMFAGLWEGWKAPDAEDWLHTFTIITGEPGKVSSDIHDRQPVILPPDVWDVWLTAEPADAAKILQEVPEAELVYYPVTRAMGKPSVQGPEAVAPIELIS